MYVCKGMLLIYMSIPLYVYIFVCVYVPLFGLIGMTTQAKALFYVHVCMCLSLHVSVYVPLGVCSVCALQCGSQYVCMLSGSTSSGH